jgi:hypothetical protein
VWFVALECAAMGRLSINSLLKLTSSLSAFEALMLGFLLFCAIGGAAVAIYVAIRSLVDARAERRGLRRGKPQP